MKKYYHILISLLIAFILWGLLMLGSLTYSPVLETIFELEYITACCFAGYYITKKDLESRLL